REIGLPAQPVVAHLDCLQRDYQVVALLEKVSGDDSGNVQLTAGLLGVDVVAGVLLGERRRTNVQTARVSKCAGDFIGQRRAKEINADVAVDVAQRQHGNGVLGCAAAT